MARRVLQFPVRNAFAPRAQDSLARDTQDHAHRIVEQVEDELARKAQRVARGNNAEMERARSYGVVIMPRASRGGKLRKNFAAVLVFISTFVANLFGRRPKPQ